MTSVRLKQGMLLCFSCPWVVGIAYIHHSFTHLSKSYLVGAVLVTKRQNEPCYLPWHLSAFPILFQNTHPVLLESSIYLLTHLPRQCNRIFPLLQRWGNKITKRCNRIWWDADHKWRVGQLQQFWTVLSLAKLYVIGYCSWGGCEDTRTAYLYHVEKLIKNTHSWFPESITLNVRWHVVKSIWNFSWAVVWHPSPLWELL